LGADDEALDLGLAGVLYYIYSLVCMVGVGREKERKREREREELRREDGEMGERQYHIPSLRGPACKDKCNGLAVSVLQVIGADELAALEGDICVCGERGRDGESREGGDKAGVDAELHGEEIGW
jgi:hypothetical protein